MNTTDYGLERAVEKANEKTRSPYAAIVDTAIISLIESNKADAYKYRTEHLEMVLRRVVVALQHGKTEEALKIGMNAICGG